jgi:transcriptional regulator with XRE-family HTH domain
LKGEVFLSRRGYVTAEELLADDLQDPKFRAEWEASTPARALANRLIQYRIDHGMTQTALGRKLGMSQPGVARVEIGEHLPTIATLQRISEALEIEILIDIRPATRGRSWVNPAAEKTATVVERVTTASGSELLVAAS